MRIKTALTGIAAAVCATFALAPSAYAADPVYDTPNLVVNEQTGRCLDSDLNGNVYTKTCTANNPYQMWIPYKDQMDLWQLRNQRTGRCLGAVNATTVRTMSCTTRYDPYLWHLYTDLGSNAVVNEQWPNVLDSNSKGDVYLKAGTHNNRYQSWLFYRVQP